MDGLQYLFFLVCQCAATLSQKQTLLESSAPARKGVAIADTSLLPSLKRAGV